MSVIADRIVSDLKLILGPQRSENASKTLTKIFQNMFDLCYSTGASLKVPNRLGLTPLMLAAKLQRVEVSVSSSILSLLEPQN